MGQGETIAWINARDKHEYDQAMGDLRRLRSHAHKIIGAFVSKMPTITQWWPLPGDQDETDKGQTVSAGDFVRAFGAAFRGN